MDTSTMFKQAAQALQNDPIYKDLDSARNVNDMDEELQKQIGEFNMARLEMNSAMGNENRDEEKIAALNDNVNRLYTEIMANESMVAYNEAKDGLDALLQHVNAIISAAVNGQDPMTVQAPHDEDGCSGSCSSCGGCH
ncbi:MAG: YlbF family regulator [Oscillospiraceae bacterium]